MNINNVVRWGSAIPFAVVCLCLYQCQFVFLAGALMVFVAMRYWLQVVDRRECQQSYVLIDEAWVVVEKLPEDCPRDRRRALLDTFLVHVSVHINKWPEDKSKNMMLYRSIYFQAVND